MGLLGHGVLVCEDCVGAEGKGVFVVGLVGGGGRDESFVVVERGRVVRVDCGDDGQVVLVFVEVEVGGCAGVVEGVV